MTYSKPDALTGLTEILLKAAEELSEDRRQALQIARRRSGVGHTLRPGRNTPLWNALVAEIRPHLKKHGTQAQLARLLGLDRQAVNSFFSAGTRMPDAERTLQLITWLVAVRQELPPS
jgi:hypothetical protein